MDLPSVTLRPNEIADVDIEPLKGGVYGRADFDDVSIQVLNTGTSGSLIGALNGHDSSTGMTYDVPLRDIGGLRNSTGAYPWRLDHDLSTIVSISNIAPMRSEIVAQINYPGGPYLLNPRRLAAGETVLYDLRKIRDEQIPDSNGHTIPLSVNGGQFRWFIHGPGSGRLIGRAEMLSVSKSISSSYSCPGSSCPAQFSYAYLDPDPVYLGPGDYAVVRAKEIDCDDFNCIGPFNAWVTSWDVTDPYGAVLYYDNGDNLQLVGFNGGTAYLRANIGYERYYWEEQASYCQDEGMDTGYADGQARVVHINSISPARGPVGTTVPVTIFGGWFDPNATPTIHVSGSGVTVSNTNLISTGVISANFNIASDAASGNHSVTLTSHGITSNGVYFYVQIPTSLRRDSLSDVIEISNGSIVDGLGVTRGTNKCGAYRTAAYQLMDQENPAQPIAAAVELDEVFSNYQGPSNLYPGPSRGGGTNADGRIADVLGRVEDYPTCPGAFSLSFTQGFQVVIANQIFTLTPTNSIAMSFDGGLEWVVSVNGL